MYVQRANNNESEAVKEQASNNSETTRRQQQANEALAACCGCNSNHEFETRQSKMENQMPRSIEFSAEMLKDQELLVSTLSQQGISEALIRRQFNKLLEEQSRQLARQQQRELSAKTSRPEEHSQPRSCSREREREIRKRPETSTSSLMKLRTNRELRDSRSRNNGLQDVVTAVQIIDKCKPHVSDSKTSRSARVRLNGAQDVNAPESETFCQAYSLRGPSEFKRNASNVSANGLENSRRNAQAHPHVCSTKSSDETHSSGPATGDNCVESRQPTNTALPEFEHASRCDHSSDLVNRQFPLIQEPKVFGGFTYFARKPQTTTQFARNAHPLPLQSPSACLESTVTDRSHHHSQLSTMHSAKCQHKSVCAS